MNIFLFNRIYYSLTLGNLALYYRILYLYILIFTGIYIFFVLYHIYFQEQEKDVLMIVSCAGVNLVSLHS